MTVQNNRNLPKPSLLTQEWADNMANPENQGIIDIDIGLIFDYLTASSWYKEGDVFPSIFLNYVPAIQLKRALNSLVETEKLLPNQTREQLQHKTVAMLKRLLTKDARPPAIVARELLISGLCKQAREPAPYYCEQFKSHARCLPDMEEPPTQLFLIELFLNGLSATLRPNCSFDMYNQPWTNLQKLMDHTIIEEQKLNPPSATTLPVRPRTQGTFSAAVSERPYKRHKSEPEFHYTIRTRNVYVKRTIEPKQLVTTQAIIELTAI